MGNLLLGLLFPLATIDTSGASRRPSDVLNDVMPGVITLAVVGVWLALTALGRSVPDALNAILQVVVGFYFGQHVAMAAARGIISSATTAASAAQTASAAAATATVAATAVTTAATLAATQTPNGAPKV